MAKKKQRVGEDVQPSKRELEVLKLLSQGLHYKEIASKMQISVETVRTYIKSIYRKLNVDSRTEAAMVYLGHKSPTQNRTKS